MTPDPTPAERYEDLLGEFNDTEGVTLPHGSGGFGRNALKYRGKIFAALLGSGALVVKLPRQRVDELVGEGHGERWDANKGTPMKEWFVAGKDCPVTWSALAADALKFARESSRPLSH